MYAMDNLLTLISTERAQELTLRPGSPPRVVLGGDDADHPLEGPPLSGEEVEHLLRTVANTRHMRELWASGAVDFVYTLKGASPFLVQARLTDGQVSVQVR